MVTRSLKADELLVDAADIWTEISLHGNYFVYQQQ